MRQNSRAPLERPLGKPPNEQIDELVAAAAAAGERRIDCIAVVTDAARPTPPCGGCRQVLWEFGPESLVVSQTTSGERVAWALEDLIPDAFGPDSFGPDPHR